MAVTGFGEVAEVLRRATVVVQTKNRGGGSGVIWSSDGSIVTNAHVIRGSHAHVQLWDSREFQATVASRDARRDLAHLRIEASNLPAPAIADSSQIRPGELAIAVGNPLGFVGALTTGVIHAIGPVRETGARHWVQAGVRLAPGNSGGPLADAEGRVVGINTMVAGRLALAVPSNDVAAFLSSAHERVALGVTLREIPRVGLLILEVTLASPAERASLMPGDILVGITPDELQDAIDRAAVLHLRFTRGGHPAIREVAVRLRAAEAAA